MDFWMILKAAAVGGGLCVIGQLLIDYTKLTPARILVGYVVAGVVLPGLGLYAPRVEFAGGGATFEDIALFARHRPEGLKIKAAGGIASLLDAERFIALGADRLGTSRIVKIVKELEKEGKFHV